MSLQPEVNCSRAGGDQGDGIIDEVVKLSIQIRRSEYVTGVPDLDSCEGDG